VATVTAGLVFIAIGVFFLWVAFKLHKDESASPRLRPGWSFYTLFYFYAVLGPINIGAGLAMVVGS